MPKAASEILCSNLTQGLHAAAQPLAILRAGLSKDHIDRMRTDELRELAANSAREVERVCALFSCLQQLVMTETIKPDLSATPVLPLLAHVADEVNLLFEEDGMCLNATVPDTCQPVLINSARTLQALTSVLLIVHAVSRAEDTIELIVSLSASAVQVVVRNANPYVGTMNTEASLRMALADANIRSQQGKFSWSAAPFSVQIELPKAPLAQ